MRDARNVSYRGLKHTPSSHPYRPPGSRRVAAPDVLPSHYSSVQRCSPRGCSTKSDCHNAFNLS